MFFAKRKEQPFVEIWREKVLASKLFHLYYNKNRQKMLIPKILFVKETKDPVKTAPVFREGGEPRRFPYKKGGRDLAKDSVLLPFYEKRLSNVLW